MGHSIQMKPDLCSESGLRSASRMPRFRLTDDSPSTEMRNALR